MAYMSQEKKAKIKAELVKAIPKSWKWSLGVRHHSTIVLNIRSAPVDIIGIYAKACAENVREGIIKSGHLDMNPYYFKDHFEGKLLETFTKIFDALNLNNHDNSDIMTDYFDVGHYVDVNVGQWNKPFVFTGKPVKDLQLTAIRY